jgi:hypothetical protein
MVRLNAENTARIRASAPSFVKGLVEIPYLQKHLVVSPGGQPRQTGRVDKEDL